jgi:hypothetical protein
MGTDKLKRLRKAIPEMEKRVKDAREHLAMHGAGGVGQPYRDKWSRRKEPARLIEATQFAKKKDKQDRPPKPAVLAELTVPRK